MRLKSRIKRLKAQNREVNLNHYSLIGFSGYEAKEAANRFWVGAGVFAIFVFILFIFGNWIYTAQISGTNPELIRANAAAEKMREEDSRKDKQQYIDGCKAAGKTPGNINAIS